MATGTIMNAGGAGAGAEADRSAREGIHLVRRRPAAAPAAAPTPAAPAAPAPAPPLRLSSLLRYVLTTMSAKATLPLTIPQSCCHGGWRCRNRVEWRLWDGRNFVFFCGGHMEVFWGAGHDTADFGFDRWIS